MSYDKEIKNIQLMYDNFIKENELTEKKLSEYDASLTIIREETINSEILDKVNKVFTSMQSACNKIVQMEGLLKKNHLETALKKAVPNYDKKRFLNELRDNYNDFSSYIKKYCVKGVNSDASIVNGLAQCFNNVLYIRKNIENYLNVYIRENEVKRMAVSKLTTERNVYFNERRHNSNKCKNEAIDLIKKVKEEINSYKARTEVETVFSAEPQINSAFDSAEIIIGKAEKPSEIIDFPQFAEKINLPNTFTEKIDLNVNDNSANILIKYDEANGESEDLYAIIESLLVRFVQSYPAYFKNIYAMHQRLGSKIISILGRISPKPNAKLLASGKHPGVETSQDGIRSAVSNLGKMLEERMSILSSGYNNIISFNASNNVNAEPLILVLFKDYPNGIDEQSKKNLIDIMRYGNIHGLYLLLICNDKVDDELTKLCNNKYIYSDKQLHIDNRTVNSVLGNENLNNSYYEKMHDKMKGYSNSIRFNDINDEHPVHKRSFSSCLEIPIGKEGSNRLTLDLEVRSPAAHVVIAGTSGSGKSSLLQNIVLGGAWNYSPEELNFWLMDFKDGTGFSEDTYKRLKHVKMMALKNKRKDASELLKYLNDEMHRRLENISKAGGGDLVDYNEKQMKKDQPLMPRLVVVIDEYTQMSRMRDCIEVLKNIAQQGRAAGISLIMCSQLYDDAFSETVSQANHRFEFTNNKLGRLVTDCDQQDASFLSSLIGNCLYSDGMCKRRIRAAYAGKAEEQDKLIDAINSKYPDIKGYETVIMGKPDFSIRPATSLIVDENSTKTEFKKNRRVVSKIGETRLGGFVEYKIDTENPLLFIFGDECRAASIEYTLLKKFSKLSEGEHNIYYLDLVRSADRETNVMLEWRKKGDSSIKFARTAEDIVAVLKELNAIYHKRVDLLEDGENIGGPIELVIHSADDLLKQIKKAQEKISSAKSSAANDKMFGNLNNLSEDELWAMASGSGFSTVTDAPNNNDDINLLSVFRELFANGKRYRIYMMLHFAEPNAFDDAKMNLFGIEPNMKDAIVVPKRLDDDDIVSYKQIVDCLKAAKQSVYAGLYEDQEGGLDKSEMEYAIIIDESQPTKFLPYEWSVE